MTDSAQPRHILHTELEVIHGPVTADGGELRQLSGSDYGLITSVMTSRAVPGSGPRRHRHPHLETIVLHEGQGRYEVEGSYVRGCDLWTFRDGLVSRKDSFWKIVER